MEISKRTPIKETHVEVLIKQTKTEKTSKINEEVIIKKEPINQKIEEEVIIKKESEDVETS